MNSPSASSPERSTPRPASLKSRVSLVWSFLVLIACLVGCERAAIPAEQRWTTLDAANDQPVVIGFVEEAGALANATRHGLETALDLRNQAGGLRGRRLELSIVTAPETPRAALEAADSLIRDPKTAAVFLHASTDVTSALVRSAGFHGVASISLASSPVSSPQERPPYFMDLARESSRQARLLADACKDNGLYRVGVYSFLTYENQRFANEFQQRLEGAGLSTAFHRVYDMETDDASLLDSLRTALEQPNLEQPNLEQPGLSRAPMDTPDQPDGDPIGSFDPDEADALFSTQTDSNSPDTDSPDTIRGLRLAGSVDAIFIAAEPEQALRIVTLTHESGLLPAETPYLGGRALQAAVNAGEPFDPAFTAYCATVAPPPALQEGHDAFIAAYESTYEEPPDALALLSFHAATGYLLAVQRADSFAPPAVLSALRSIIGGDPTSDEPIARLFTRKVGLIHYADGAWSLIDAAP